MKNGLFKNKKFIIILGIVLVVALVVCLFIFLKNDEEERVLKEENSTFYVKINPLVKLTVKTSYYECDGTICSDYTHEVVNTSLMNEVAQDVYGNIDINNPNLVDAIVSLLKIAQENDLDISTINITSNWKYGLEDINQEIKDKILTELSQEIEITFDYQETINEKEILANDIEKYTVTFDSDGGTAVESQIVIENELVTEPSDPTKDDYDFNSEVTSDIILKATWEEIPRCTPKKFDKTYSYVYEDEETCMKEGNNAFFEVSDNIDDSIFTYGCEEIVDDCGTTWYGVYFNYYDYSSSSVEQVYY